MKKGIKTLALSLFFALFVLQLFNSCKKTAVVTPKSLINTTPKLIYSMDDTLGKTNTELWSVTIDGVTNKKIPVTLPANLQFDFESNIAAEVSTDDKTLALSLEDTLDNNTYLYKSNIDGSNVQPIPQINGFIYLQTFINSTSILYWKFTGSNQDDITNGELWEINTDGSNNHQLNISLPTGVGFGDGKFAKVTSDGKTIYFSTLSTNGAAAPILKCNIDGTGVTAITSGYIDPVVGNVPSALEALINNNIILYRIYGQFGSSDELWEVNVDGSNNNRLQPGFTLADSRVQASATKIYYLVIEPGNLEAIYSFDINDTNFKLVLNIPPGYHAKLQGLIQ